MVLVLDAAIAVAGISIAHGSGLLGLLAAGPLLACARCGGRATALVAAYAIALCAIAAAVVGAEDSTLASYRFIMVVVAGVVAVFVAVIRSRREGALIRVNDRVQRAILRPLPAEFGGVAFASHYQSATKQALIGGDLYDIAMGDRLLFYTDGLVETRDHKGRFFELDLQVAQALAEPDLDAAIRQLVRLLLKHAGRRLADDVLLVLSEPSATRVDRPDDVALTGGHETNQ
jgi:hypothetical protein